MRESKMDRIARAARLSAALAELYPEARISLDFKTPWQCLVATILSAQCTDKRVNLVTEELFKKYRTASDYASANPAELAAVRGTIGLESDQRFGFRLPAGHRVFVLDSAQPNDHTWLAARTARAEDCCAPE